MTSPRQDAVAARTDDLINKLSADYKNNSGGRRQGIKDEGRGKRAMTLYELPTSLFELRRGQNQSLTPASVGNR
jgi:hypothetical protein